MLLHYIQALTTPRKIRLPIGQTAGKIQVVHIKIQVVPAHLPSPIVNDKVYDDFTIYSKIKFNINGFRSTENNEKLYFRRKCLFCTLNKICSHAYNMDVSTFPIRRGKSISKKMGVLSTKEWAFNNHVIYHLPHKEGSAPTLSKIWGK